VIAHLNILVICAVLVGAFGGQFGQGEFPCPLCRLQRMAMMLCALGPAYVIMKARAGEAETTGFATGYGMSVVAAVAGAFISIRWVLVHTVPPDPGYGEAVPGLHLYTWALLVFLGEMITASLNLMFARELKPQGEIEFGWLSRPYSGCWVRWSSRKRARSLLRRGYTGLCPTTQSATDCSTYQAVNPRKSACTKRPFEVVSVL
jgi:disulfide bond formation protein DsbB